MRIRIIKKIADSSRKWGYYVIGSVLLVILAYIFIVDAKYQLILNKELAYIGMEQQQIKQISTGEMSAYLSCIDHRLISHDILVAIAGVFFTTIAFFAQYAFNRNQKIDLSQERLENNYSHLLDILRMIRRDVEIPFVGKGSVALHYMFYEYKAIYNLFSKDKYLTNNMKDDKLNKIAFSIFLNGVSDNFGSDVQIVQLNRKERKQINLLCDKLKQYRENSEQGNDGGVTYIMDYKGKRIKYFDGHRMRLIPYVKCLFVIFDFIQSHKTNFIDGIDYPYRLLFSEMSDHEIGLIYSYYKYRDDNNYDDCIEGMISTLDHEYKAKFIFTENNFIKRPKT